MVVAAAAEGGKTVVGQDIVGLRSDQMHLMESSDMVVVVAAAIVAAVVVVVSQNAVVVVDYRVRMIQVKIVLAGLKRRIVNFETLICMV